ncbi:MAG: FeoA family protein [Thermoanaerobaculia bacterium]|nr:FeoA family protein [Thermoanaerobaculia bacterium]
MEPTAPLPETTVSLSRLLPGRCGVVISVEAGDAEIEQLKAMGVCEGREVMLVQAGDPLILRVMGTRIGVSARLAASVRVDACAGDTFGTRPGPAGGA